MLSQNLERVLTSKVFGRDNRTRTGWQSGLSIVYLQITGLSCILDIAIAQDLTCEMQVLLHSLQSGGCDCCTLSTEVRKIHDQTKQNYVRRYNS